jgi:tripartite-type tricarboxylate transporter receptor subunit TctC
MQIMRLVYMNPCKKIRGLFTKRSRSKVILHPSTFILGCALAFAAGAQQYPAKPVRLIVPFAPGGSTDITARILAQKLTDAWRQLVLVDTGGGGGGNIGAEAVVRAAPDGYTLLLATTGVMSINMHLYRTLSYDAARDLAPVTQIGALPLILVVHPSLPTRSVKELIAVAKAKPGALTYASSGVGGATHMTAELFRMMAGVDITHIPYKGSGQAMIDLVSGQVTVAFDQIVSSLPHVESGKLRALAVTSAKRFESVPRLPTVAEAGVPGYEAISWNGIAAPAGAPAPILNRVQGDTARVLQLPDIRERFAKDGIEPVGSTPEQFAAHIRSEREKWGKVVKSAGIQAQ